MSSPSPPTEQRINHREEWLESLARDFSQATGWKLRFCTATSERVDSPDGESPWHREIRAGTQLVGTFHLTAPLDRQPDLSFESSWRLAEMIVENVNRFLDQQSQVYQQAEEIGMLVRPAETDNGDFRNRLHALLRATVCLTGFRAAALFVLDPDGASIRLRFSHHLKEVEIPNHRRTIVDEPPDLAALESGLVQIARDSDCDTSWLPDGMNSAICVPVENDSGPVGTLWLYDRRFKASDTLRPDLLRGFGRQIADVFERVVLLRDAETCDRLARELDIVASTAEDYRDVRRTFPGCEVAVRCLSRCEVGGDLCEVLPIDEHRTVFVIGDGSGDSIPAAMVMTATRGAVHALLESYRGSNRELRTDQFISELNQAILHVTASQQFITLIFGLFDGRTGTLRYTNAGHPPPLHVHDGVISPLESQGLLLGVLDEATYTSATLQMRPDEMLILFSDGIIEARNRASQEMFREEGIVEALQSEQIENASDALSTIWDRYEQHTDGENMDDRTLMVLRSLSID